MLNFTPNELSERENYKFLIGSIIPRPIALISTLNTDDTINIAPFSYFNIVSSIPPILGVSIQRTSGEMKDTAKNIVRTKEAVIHIVDNDNVYDTNQTAATLSYGDSEFERTEFHLTHSKTITTPAI